MKLLKQEIYLDVIDSMIKELLDFCPWQVTFFVQIEVRSAVALMTAILTPDRNG